MKNLGKHPYNGIHTNNNKDQSAHKHQEINDGRKVYTNAQRQTQNEACTNMQCQANSPQVIFEMREEEGGAPAERAY